MRHDPIYQREQAAFDLRDFTQALIIHCIKAETDPLERYAKIGIAVSHGHITAQEAETLA